MGEAPRRSQESELMKMSDEMADMMKMYLDEAGNPTSWVGWGLA